jgi:hypothetical protein
VLVAAYEALEDAGSVYPNVQSEHINERLGRAPDDPRHDFALEYLRKAGYISGQRAGNAPHWHLVTLERDGLVEVAGWPARAGSDFAAQLLDVLDHRIETAEDEDERTRLQRFRDAVTSVGRQITTDVLSELAQRSVGL